MKIQNRKLIDRNHRPESLDILDILVVQSIIVHTQQIAVNINSSVTTRVTVMSRSDTRVTKSFDHRHNRGQLPCGSRPLPKSTGLAANEAMCHFLPICVQELAA